MGLFHVEHESKGAFRAMGEGVGREGWVVDFDRARREWGHHRKGALPQGAWDLLREYALLLDKWSGRMSLISAGDRDFLATRHFLPAWRWLPIMAGLPNRSLLDVGSGAGLPGIPLKIALPDTWVFLVESRRRRANFLREVVRRLDLKKVRVINGRLEDWEGIPGGVDLAISRGVQKPVDFCRMVGPFVAPHGCILVHLHSHTDGGIGRGTLWKMDREEGLGGGKIGVILKRG